MIDVWKKLASDPGTLKRIIFSSGVIDPVVAMHGTEAAVHALGFDIIEGGSRRPYFYDASSVPISLLGQKPLSWGQTLHAVDAGAQVGGFVTNFEAPSGIPVSFVTVRASGALFACLQLRSRIFTEILRGVPNHSNYAQAF